MTPGPLIFLTLVETRIACLYSDQNELSCQDLQIDCYTGSWLTLIILGLITAKLIMRILQLSRAWAQCTSRRPCSS